MSSADLNIEYLTCKEVARLLRCKRETVQAYARDGLLLGSKVGRNWLFTRDAVRAFVTSR